MRRKKAQEFCSLIGQAFAGSGRLSDGTTLLEKYPERYRNVFTDWVDLLIAEAKIKQSLERQDKEASVEWIELEEGTALPPRGEKVLLYLGNGEIVYQELEYSTDMFGDGRVGPAFTHFARVRPPRPTGPDPDCPNCDGTGGALPDGACGSCWNWVDNPAWKYYHERRVGIVNR